MTEPMPFFDNLPRFTEPALCAETDPEAHFPEPGTPNIEAKRTCSLCKARLECLTYALKNNEMYGVWGGLGERERRRLRTRETPPSRAELLALVNMPPEPPPPGPGRKPNPREHGSERGYQQHRHRGDMPACDPCLKAHAAAIARQQMATRERTEPAA